MVEIFYIFNAVLLLLHEIESAYEKEWEILKLPGKISGFLLLHIPIIVLLFYGLLMVNEQKIIGFIIAIIFGIGGIMPFFVHKIFFKTNNNFRTLISNVVIYFNIITGIVLVILSCKNIY